MIKARDFTTFVCGVGALFAGNVSAAPPPPALEPPELSQVIEGYDLSAPFQLWFYWVESRKGEVVQSLLAQPDELPGERTIGPPIFTFTRTNDYGHYMSGEIRQYCRSSGPRDIDRGHCHYLYRAAYVPHDAVTYQDDNPVSRWTRAAFDSERLARHLRETGFAPDTDWWLADRARMFTAMPSPVPVLTQNATVDRRDSRDCPGIAAAIAELERQRIDWRVDLIGVGEDEGAPPTPHGISTEYSLTIFVPGRGGVVTLTGAAGRFEELTRPIWDAMTACEGRAPATIPAGN